MSSYGSMSPSDEGYDRYETPFYCHPLAQQGSPMESGMYWQGNEQQEYETTDVYHNEHFIGRGFAYDEMTISGNDGYDGYHQQNMHHGYTQNNMGIDCDIALPLRPFDRPPTSFVRVVKRRTTANKKERRRTQSINTAFSDLRECIPNVPADTKLSKVRVAAEKKERRRTLGINAAFTDLKGRIPNVPADTKLSKIKTLRLATSYISYLMKVLENDGEPAGGFRAELHHTPPRRQRNHDSNAQTQSESKKGKGRTGWPQHVWALELKNEQNLQT